jgi:hypothetical protein
VTPEAERVRNLVAQLGLPRAAAAALLRELAAELDRGPTALHLCEAAWREAVRLRDLGFSVGPPPSYAIRTPAVAHLLDRASKTVRSWRSDACGPAWQSDGAGRVSYALPDVLAWRDGVSRLVPITETTGVV